MVSVLPMGTIYIAGSLFPGQTTAPPPLPQNETFSPTMLDPTCGVAYPTLSPEDAQKVYNQFMSMVINSRGLPIEMTPGTLLLNTSASTTHPPSPSVTAFPTERSLFMAHSPRHEYRPSVTVMRMSSPTMISSTLSSPSRSPTLANRASTVTSLRGNRSRSASCVSKRTALPHRTSPVAIQPRPTSCSVSGKPNMRRHSADLATRWSHFDFELVNMRN
jgi:hypothetical protein